MEATLSKIEEQHKIDFLPKYFTGMNLMHFENLLYTMAKQKIEEYKGGMWDFYEIEIEGKTAPLLVWSTNKEKLTLIGFDRTIETDTFSASLAVFNMALNHFLHICKSQSEVERLIDVYHTLNAYTYGDFEKTKAIDVSSIYSFLD